MTNERKFIQENILRYLLTETLRNKSQQAGFGGIDIQRTPLGTNIVLYVQKPGLVIGRQGAIINQMTKDIETIFNIPNPQIEAKLVENRNLNATVMAQTLADALERGWHFRRAGHSTVKRIMNSGAKGCQVILSGKLTGQRHRTEKFREGKIKYCGEPRLQWLDEGMAVAKKKLGTIGVKVQIMPPEAKLPDEITVFDEKPLTPEEIEDRKADVEAQEKAAETTEAVEAEKKSVEAAKEEEPVPEETLDSPEEAPAEDAATVESSEAEGVNNA